MTVLEENWTETIEVLPGDPKVHWQAHGVHPPVAYCNLKREKFIDKNPIKVTCGKCLERMMDRINP